MKDGKYAVYLGKVYRSGINKDGKLLLRSSDIKDIKNGFEACEPFKFKDEGEDIVCIKYINREDVEAYYKVITKAYIRNGLIKTRLKLKLKSMTYSF